MLFFFFFFQAEDGIRDYKVTGVQTCALPISFLPAEVRAGGHPVVHRRQDAWRAALPHRDRRVAGGRPWDAGAGDRRVDDLAAGGAGPGGAAAGGGADGLDFRDASVEEPPKGGRL